MDKLTKIAGEVQQTPLLAENGINCKICGNHGYVPGIENGHPVMKQCICLRQRQQERFLQESGIAIWDYQRYRMDTFKVDTPDAQEMMKYAQKFLHEWKDGAGIGYFGKPGTGKTHICIAICHELCVGHRYFQYRTEIQKLKNVAYSDGETYDHLMKQWKKARVLYIDDLFKGAMTNGKLDKQDLQIMFDILNNRCMGKYSTIISSEYSLQDITKADEAIGSRIYQMINPYIYGVKGKNRRLA